jgi:hypothetical protein
MENYFKKIRKILYDKGILPIFVRQSDQSMSVEEIAERMKPVPYKQIEHRLPKEFARNVRLILEAKL